MSVGFSTIRPLDPSTISKAPAYSTNNQQTQQPAASSPMDAGQPVPKKKSHWFAKTLATVVVLAAAAGLGRKFLPDTFNPELVLKDGAKWYEKGLHYAQKYIGKAGEYINTKTVAAYNWVVNLFKGKGKEAVAEAAEATTQAV